MDDEFEITKRRHPLYSYYESEWEFYLEAAMGGKEYCTNEDNLFTHRLEDSIDDYNDRLDRVYYLNYCNLVCSIYADYIFKETIRRPTDKILDPFRRNVDGKGTDIDTYMMKISMLSSIFGHVHILVDSPRVPGIKIPLHVYRNNRERYNPYMLLITPLDLVDWSVDAFGKPIWVMIRFKSYNDENPLVPREDKEEYLLIARDEWIRYNSENIKIDAGDNPLGEVFMVTCYNKDTNMDLIGESLIADISRINRTIYNWCSNIDEMIERQTFSQLVLPVSSQGELNEAEETDEPLRKIGTAQAFTFPAESGQPPRFISPDAGQINIIWKMIQEHIDKIYELAGLGTVGEKSKFLSQRSGISQGYQFLQTNASLAKKSARLEKAENDINRLVYMWAGEDSLPPPVEYPKQFDILSLTDTLNITFDIVSRNISATLNIELLKGLARKAAPVLPDEVLDRIYKEIEINKGKIETPNLRRVQPPEVARK